MCGRIDVNSFGNVILLFSFNFSRCPFYLLIFPPLQPRFELISLLPILNVKRQKNRGYGDY